MEARLHRPRPLANGSGNLTLWELEEVAQMKKALVAKRQLGDGRLHPAELSFRLDSLSRPLNQGGVRRFGETPGRRRASGPTPDLVQGQIGDYAQEPWTKGRPVAKAAEVAIRADEGLLDDVLGRCTVAQQEPGGAKRYLLVCADESAKRVRVTALRAGDGLFFGQRDAHSSRIHRETAVGSPVPRP